MRHARGVAEEPLKLDAVSRRVLARVQARVRRTGVLETFTFGKSAGLEWLEVRDSAGNVGAAVGIAKLPAVKSLLERLVLPRFEGVDAGMVAADAAGIALGTWNYKFAGLPFWVAVSLVELAVFDLLGRAGRCPVSEFLGRRRRESVPVYLSSMRRDTSPEQEVADLRRVRDETGAHAVKIKIGGRMSGNADASPGRTPRLLRLCRKELGDGMELFADANGSYDAAHAVKVGRIMEDLGYGFLEEPCPFEDFEAQRIVAGELKIPVASGEQDSSLPKFEWLLGSRAVGVLQPDVHYNGGLVRTLRVARMAERYGVPVIPHSPQPGAPALHALHLVAVLPNLFPFLEFNAFADHAAQAFGAPLTVRDGEVPIPDGPGLGYRVGRER